MKVTGNKLTINAMSAVLQVVITALLYFFLYKYLIKTIGVKQLGVWSLILSFSSIANLANMGLTSGLVKFVAEYILDVDKTKLGKLIFTSVLSMTVLFGLLCVLIYFGAHFFLGYLIDVKFLDIALQILPYSLASLSINAIGGVFTSVLEGYQKNYIRNFIYIATGILMFFFTVLLTPLYGLKGVAIAQVLQSFAIFALAMIFMIKLDPNNGIRRWRWSSLSFKDLFNYGYKFQLVSISQLLYEPATKLLLSKYGGLVFLGHYEMATKAINQFRALLTNANQVVIPVVAEKSKIGGTSFVQDFYMKMNRILLLFSLPISTVLFITIPFISLLWLNGFNFDFIFSMQVLTLATFFNIMCGPAYFSSMGEGKLNILVIVHIGMALINLFLGYLLGRYFFGYGIVVAWAISLSGGSLFLIFNYNKTIKVGLLEIFQRSEIRLFAVSTFIIIINVLVYSLLSSDRVVLRLGISLATLLLYLPVFLNNRNLKELITTLKK